MQKINRITKMFPSLLIFLLLAPPVELSQSNGQTQSDVETAWKRIANVEQGHSLRVARFLGFIEGYFRISAPNVWQEKGNGGIVDSALSVLCESSSDDIHVKILGETESKNPVVQVRSDFESRNILWDHELTGLSPMVVHGPAAIYANVIIDPNVIYVFGRIGNTEPVRFLRILSREDGHVMMHFAFLAYRKSNMGRVLSDDELKAETTEREVYTNK